MTTFSGDFLKPQLAVLNTPLTTIFPFNCYLAGMAVLFDKPVLVNGDQREAKGQQHLVRTSYPKCQSPWWWRTILIHSCWEVSPGS